MSSGLKDSVTDDSVVTNRIQRPVPALANVISSGTGRLRPRAHLIRTIGAELISSEVVAILELVRNSYDADAQRVEIRFTLPHQPSEASIEILDDGHGMTEEVLLGPWLEPATSYKSKKYIGLLAGEFSPSGRRRLGSKGVGRFATQRLGKHLTVRTQAAEAPFELEADFNWDELDNADQYLDELVIPWRKLDASNPKVHGTSLYISQLRDAWTEERFEKLRLALSRLLGPGLEDPFYIFLVINGSREEIKPFLDSVPAMFSIEGSVSEGGSCHILYRDITGTEEHWQRTVVWPLYGTCGPFSFRINSWDLDKDAVAHFLNKTGSRMGPRDFKRAIREHSGISLYRDGFRILPYGEPDNDWLRLDRRRVNNPTVRLSNNQILGWIHLKADTNPFLQDQTNREGLVANEAYSHLQQVLLELLSYLEARRFNARRTLGITGRIEQVSSHYREKSSHDIEELFSQLTEKDRNLNSEKLHEIRRLIDANRESALAALTRYTMSATSGILSGKIVARAGHPLKRALGEILFLQAELRSSEMPDNLKSDLLTAAEKIALSLQEVDTCYSIVAKMCTQAENRKESPINLADCIENIADLYLDDFVRRGIEFRLEVNAESTFLAPPQIVQQVLALILDNSSYWVQRSKANRLIEARIYTGGFVIENSGPPVQKGLHDRIFEPFFTTREGSPGLGLTLARDLLKLIGGFIKSTRGNLGGACFEVRLPKKA